MAHKIFAWAALLTWGLILGGALTYTGLYLLTDVVDKPARSTIEKLPDRFPPSRTSIG